MLIIPLLMKAPCSFFGSGKPGLFFVRGSENVCDGWEEEEYREIF